MNLYLDIGNTAVKYGLFAEGRLKRLGMSLNYDIPKIIRICSCGGAHNYKNVIISSVVPELTKKSVDLFRKSKSTSLWIVGVNIPLKIKHKYHNYNKLGKDRAVNIYGALKKYKLPLLVLDFGTALKADYISKQGVFEGGLIIPGPEISFQALLSRAALLPKNMRLPEKSVSLLGKNTLDCMKAGILEGYGSMADGLIERFKRKFGSNLTVLATGGFSRHLKPYTRRLDIVDPWHSIKSLHLLFQEFSK